MYALCYLCSHGTAVVVMVMIMIMVMATLVCAVITSK